MVDFPLYLAALGWSGVAIGALFTAIVTFQATLTLFSHPLSDRHGRKGFLLVYETALIAAAALALASDSAWAITVAAIVGGFGRGINGAAGPFSPVEQAWLARVTPLPRRGAIFSLNTALGSLGMGLGALLAVLPSLWGGRLPSAAAYRPLFALVLAFALLTLALVATLAERRRPAPAADADVPTRPEENRRLLAIAAVNALNGAAIGLIGPLITYWFHLRYGASDNVRAPACAVASASGRRKRDCPASRSGHSRRTGGNSCDHSGFWAPCRYRYRCRKRGRIAQAMPQAGPSWRRWCGVWPGSAGRVVSPAFGKPWRPFRGAWRVAPDSPARCTGNGWPA
ncbi:MAG: MFS transporter [Gammaproteobacteria bacterium]|nr:MFS transporter [Gammaproteobacteria bacterium]